MNYKLKIAIAISPDQTQHSGSWNNPWIDYCKEKNLEYSKINPYSSNILEVLRDFDIFLWAFGGYNYTHMLIARSILYSAKQMGLKVFPDFNDAWHFDDKIAETYLLQSIKAPIPESYMFYSSETLKDFANKSKDFPYVAKLRNGSGSHNVKMINSNVELKKYGEVMFSKGFSSSPSVLYKSTSNIKSTKSLNTLISRAKRIPEFLRTLKNSRMFPNEKGYVYLQEFIPNDGYDLKIVVVGNKLSYIGRNIRKGEFRASGGGDLFYDKTLVTQNVIESAFRTSDKLGFNCMGYDYVVDKNNGNGIIIEISYGFAHQALLMAGGYFDRQGNWHNEPLNAPDEILKNLQLQSGNDS